MDVMARRFRDSLGRTTKRFWAWYERHYRINLLLTTGLFAVQVVHLYWLTTHVVALRMFGADLFNPGPWWQAVIIAVDYTEIPALLSTSLLYIYELRRGFSWKNILFLIFLNSQWLHLFWITDEFVVSMLLNAHPPVILPHWLAWVAIFIDYLEIPVIIDTSRKTAVSVWNGRFVQFLREEAKYHIWHI